MTEKNIPTVETQMLIRKPASAVFQAFIDPKITTNFWFTKSSGQLEVGKTVTWEWEMYGVSNKVLVKNIVPNKKISTEWGDPVTNVDYEFTALTDDTTYVVIKNYGFNLRGDELIQAIKDNTGGFTTVLDGLKAYLEHNINLNLIGDKFPKEITKDENNKKTIYEHAGGWDALYRLSDIFYHSCLTDPILQPLFGHEKPGHVEKFTAFTAETFGGPDTFSKEMGGFVHLIDAHRGYKITEKQRQRFVELYMEAADKAEMPNDIPFRNALKSHIDFGSHVAKQNSNATTDDQLHPLREVPKWDWSKDE